MKKILLFAVLMCCALHTTAQQVKADRKTRAEGERVYLRAGCHACHGTVGHGGTAPSLAPDTLPLDAFEVWVRRGTPGWTITTGMPAYPVDILSDDEIAAIQVFLASLPAPRAVKDIPLLDN